jgi:hypothetical protein
MLQTYYEIYGIIRNSSNISVAVERAAKIIFDLRVTVIMTNPRKP